MHEVLHFARIIIKPCLYTTAEMMVHATNHTTHCQRELSEQVKISTFGASNSYFKNLELHLTENASASQLVLVYNN